MSVSTRSRVSNEQLDMLLTFMEDHPEFAANKQSVYSRFSSSKLWRLLAERLNAAAVDTGGARKSPDKWCRYWADIKYKARRKCAAGGALGDLSSVEERLSTILSCGQVDFGGSGSGVGGASTGGNSTRRPSHSDEERKPLVTLDDDMYSEGSATGAVGDGPRLSTEELLAEAAMRSALAAEKQAEAVTQAVELLRDLVTILRERPPPQHPQPTHAPHPQPPDHTDHTLAAMHHHHHRI